MKEMILTFEWDGKTVHKETKGFAEGTGPSCVEATKFMDDALGGKVKNRRFKSEYYNTVAVKNTTKLKTSS